MHLLMDIWDALLWAIIMNNASLNIHVLVIGWTHAFSPLGTYVRGCSYVYVVLLCLPYCRIASFPQRKTGNVYVLISSMRGGGDSWSQVCQHLWHKPEWFSGVSLGGGWTSGIGSG